MRIALVTDTLPIGGGTEHIYQIAKGLEHMQFGIFARGGTGAEKFRQLTNTIVHDHARDPRSVLSFKPDVIHIHHLKPLFEFYANPFVKYPVPVLFTAHGLHIHKHEFLPGIQNILLYRMRIELEKWLLRNVTTLITVSQEDQKFLEDNYNKKSVYIPNGLDAAKIELFHASKESIRNEMNWSPNTFILLTVGRFDFAKGYDILIRALSLIKSEIMKRNALFVFVGQGSTLTEMKKLSTALGVDDVICFMGQRNDVFKIMHASDAFILPSRWEGLPIVLLEAGLSKLPIIASNTYGNRELIKEGNTGLLFHNTDPADLARAIIRLMQSKESLHEMQQNAYQVFKEQYSLTAMLTKIHALYRVGQDR